MRVKDTSFGRIFQQILIGNPNGLSVVFYLDLAMPGNNRRPDDGRASQCMYFTFLELPSWFISRRNGWIPFSYVRHRDQKQASLTDSMLVKYMLCIFDSDDSDSAFGKGFAVHGGDGSIQQVRAKAFLCVADWDQHAKKFTLKGPNGSVPCWCCRNAMGRCPWFVDPILSSCA